MSRLECDIKIVASSFNGVLTCITALHIAFIRR